MSLYDKKAFSSIQYGVWTIMNKWRAVILLKSHYNHRITFTGKPCTHLTHTGHNAVPRVVAKSNNFRTFRIIKDINLKEHPVLLKNIAKRAVISTLSLYYCLWSCLGTLFAPVWFFENVKILNNLVVDEGW